MKRFIVVTDKVKRFEAHSEFIIQTPSEFIRNKEKIDSKSRKHVKVINLCSSFEYLSKGYYVSLLAEARGMSCIPSVSDIVALNWKRNYESYLPELNEIVAKYFKEEPEDPLIRGYTTYFGRHSNSKIEPIARRLFDMFRFPAMMFELRWTADQKWEIEKIENLSYSSIPEDRLSHFNSALEKFTGAAWRDALLVKKPERYWIGMLHNPKEEYPPSNTAALNKFIRVGKKMGLWVELITKSDYNSLLEFDALFIRETTAIDNYTYKFANKALSEDIPCIDDTRSIIRCCNKVYLHELLAAKEIPTPRTEILDRNSLQNGEISMTFPFVLKIPDGSFSRGVEKVKDFEEFKYKAGEMFKKSEIILMQEFVESEFDWRIGIINHEPIFALKYFMAKGHWQIYNHQSKTKSGRSGNFACVPIEEVPKEVLSGALAASKLIGNGLYGVDLKQTKSGDVVIIEVNDNPNIDSGIEDALIGDELYRKVLEHLVRLIES